MASNAIGIERVSRTVGYILKKGNFQLSSPNLPQRIVIIGEVNDANQADVDFDVPIEITSAKQAGALFGYGSPIHVEMRILRPYNSEGVGGIPTIVIPQQAAGGGAAKQIQIAVTGVATGNGTHYVIVAGRDGIDGELYAVNIQAGDNAADIHQKIEDAINNVLASPVAADSTAYHTSLTAKWKGLTSQGLTVSMDVDSDDLGLSYVVTQITAGSGTPSIGAALAALGNIWYTQMINTYGTVSAIMDAIEAVNGIPLEDAPTGRYAGIIFKPFIALTGSVLEDPSSLTDSRDTDVTIAICPAPLSPGLPFEAAANACVLFATKSQNTPHLDIGGQSYPDMPVPADLIIGAMSSFNERDNIVKKGCSTVDLVSERYQVQDFVTTYHPEGEVPPQYRYCRDLMLDFNVRFGYLLLEVANVLDHAIANDDDIVAASNVIKPKQWKAILADYADDLELRALIVDSAFTVASIDVSINTNNPNRFDTFFRYKRSGVVRQSATTAEAGFNFGTLNA